MQAARRQHRGPLTPSTAQFVALFGGAAGSGLRPRKSFAVARVSLDRHRRADAPPGVMAVENTFYHDFLDSRRTK